jgi:hypothetical protein
MTPLLLLGLTIPSWCAPTDPLVRGRDGVWAFPDPQGNFTLRARLRPAPGPAPVLRLRLVNGFGYRIALGGPTRGRLDDPGRRPGILAEPAPAPPPRELDWELSADGPRLSLRLNGQPVWEYVEREPGIRSTGTLGFTLPAGASPQQRITALELTPRPATPPSFAEKYGPAIGEPVPAFRAVDQAGRPRDLASLRGPKGLWLLFFRSADW